MNITISLLVLFAIMVPAIAWYSFRRKVQWQAALVVGGVSVAIIFAALYGSRSFQSTDIEVLNGQVASKNSERVSCEHSYQCNPRKSCSGSGQNRSCTTTYDTCYDHSYDVSWRINTTVGEFDIDRINRRGDAEPPRYSIVRAGDPVAKTQSYTNWVKAVPNSLFHHKGTFSPKLTALVPTYPTGVYDYYKLNRVLTSQVPIVDLTAWNNDISNMLRSLGPSKQVNAVIVMVKTSDPNFEHALRDKWEGGKKNDVIVILGITNYPTIDWVRIVSWTDKQLFKVQLRDEILELGTVQDRTAIMKILSDNIGRSYTRKQMRDFEYLADEITPPNWLIVGILLTILATNFAMVYVAYHETRSYRSGGLRGSRFTLVEVMIAAAMFCIVLAILYPLIF